MLIRMNRLMLLLPLWGVGVFMLLYLIAASLYPGGSGADMSASGFSLAHNYWCDLMDRFSYNGLPNPSRPLAIAAILILNVSLVAYWYFLPQIFPIHTSLHQAIRGTGIVSMLVCIFIFTPYHDQVIEIAGMFGSIALVLTIIEMYKGEQKKLFYFGLLCLGWCLASLFIYKTSIGLSLLPIAQKAAFISFFTWVGMSCLVLYRSTCQP